MITGPYEASPMESQQSMLDTNIYHVVALTKLLLPQLRKRDKRTGLIINSSASCSKVSPNASVYSSSKAFTTYFAKGLAKELVGTNVDVQCLNPFATATNIANHWGLRFIGTSCERVITKSLNDLGRD